ncbi:MAG: acyl phosphate:glycerol-3-phosphate acyltransferase [Clostridiales bacterium]|nr:acyl phosphate:glycerol-3-phosphate acyltransferase [Clostridiales bacterium]
MIGKLIACLFFGYVFGSISFGYLVGKAYHIDIRKKGSGNSGATNALRTMGIKGGLLTFFGDAFKIIIPVLLIRIFMADALPCWEVYALYLGLGGVIGHNYPIWLHFKGGKGIAVTSGVILAIADWRITLAGLIVFICVVAYTRYVSLGSLIVAWLLPLNMLLFYRSDENFVHLMTLSLIFTAFAYWRHRENIKRLLKGTERKIGKHE